jgi:hypothetical protein
MPRDVHPVITTRAMIIQQTSEGIKREKELLIDSEL